MSSAPKALVTLIIEQQTPFNAVSPTKSHVSVLTSSTALTVSRTRLNIPWITGKCTLRRLTSSNALMPSKVRRTKDNSPPIHRRVRSANQTESRRDGRIQSNIGSSYGWLCFFKNFVRAGDAAKIGPEAFLKPGRYKTPPLFRAPHAMQVTRNERVHDEQKNKRLAIASKKNRRQPGSAVPDGTCPLCLSTRR